MTADGLEILDGEYDDDLYYSYRCATCSKVWAERRHAGRRFEHCPRHRDQRQRPRQKPYHYTCRRCADRFEQAAGGPHREYCPGCSSPAASESKRRWYHENTARCRPRVRCADWLNCRVCSARPKQMPLPHTGAREDLAA